MRYQVIVPDNLTDGVHARLLALAQSAGTITVRELLAMWGARGRGSQVTASIRRTLKELDLTTEPPFGYGSLDTVVSIVPIEATEAVARTRAPSQSLTLDEPDESIEDRGILHVGQIPSALGGIATVDRSTSIGRAQTLMIRHDFSQLAVVEEDVLLGVISWASIAQAALRTNVERVSDCIINPTTVSQDSDLLASMTMIVAADYVIVLDPAGAPSGIVTTADLAAQFDRLARPFLTVGECEKELRGLLDRHFTPTDLDKLTTYKKPDKPGASAMTLGDIKKLLRHTESWKKLGLKLSQGAFIEWVDALRVIRNDIAHFNQDDEAVSPELTQIRNLTAFLRQL